MTDLVPRPVSIDGSQWGPWTVAGGPDRDFDDAARQVHHALLTHASLLTCFRRQFPAHADADYDEMVRWLGYVWDCPHDGTANVTGYRCAGCGQTRATASMAAAAHTGDARDIPTTISAG